MNKKLVLLLSIVLGLSMVFTACVSNEPAPGGIEQGELQTIKGIISDSYVENDVKYIEIKQDTTTLKLDASDIENFDSITKGSEYEIEYDANHLIVKMDLIEAEVPGEKEEEVIKEPGVLIYPIDKVDRAGLNVVSETDTSDFTNSEILKVVLYTNAAKGEDGAFQYDDSNYFMLIAETETQDYILFEETIQLGKINYSAFMQDGELNISVLYTATADVSFNVYTFDGTGFTEQNYYKGSGNINMISH